MIILITTGIVLADYNHFATWETQPGIIICESKNISKKHVEISLKHWQDLGYKFDKIQKKDTCPSKELGKIIITEKYFEDKQGLTNVKTYKYMNDQKNDYIDQATVQINQKIELSPEENKESLTHEIGHALGIDHVNDKWDIMYPYAMK